jgi:hypothetical protein
MTYDTITDEDMKRAKKKVLMTHPDKSRLPPAYFLFYKKALDIVVRLYSNQAKQAATVPTENPVYVPVHADKTVSKAIREMSASEFHTKFNTLFEKNMATTVDPTKNEWFSKEEPEYNVPKSVTANTMGEALQQVKQTQQGLVRYRGVETMYGKSSGTQLYDAESDEYQSSDIFSKLKYDDLRRVHKDQTVFAVSERDFDKVPKYRSTDQYMRERGRMVDTPMDKAVAEQMLSEQERAYKERMMKQAYQAGLRTSEYEEKNRTVLSTFLRLH